MILRRGAVAFASAIAIIFPATPFAQQPTQAPTQNQRKLSDAERREIQTVTTLANDAAAGKPAPDELQLTWVREDLLKAQGNKQYIPFTVSVDATKVTSASPLSVYWRAVSKTAAPAPAPATPPEAAKDGAKPAPPPTFAYEDFNTAAVKPGQAGARISRSLALAAGDYDVYVVVKEPTPEKKGAEAPKASVIKKTLTVPDFWNEELNTSTIFIAERIDPLPTPLTPQQQAERPYALGSMEIIPAASTRFAKSGELSTFLLIYNAKVDAANKPDVSVEFNFYTKQAGAEKFFNKTDPQQLNAQTLPPQFDIAAGHQLQSGQAVPLASFPEGDYRLEIKVTDKIANKSVTRDVNFTVAGS
jgi:hypothetical protein